MSTPITTSLNHIFINGGIPEGFNAYIDKGYEHRLIKSIHDGGSQQDLLVVYEDDRQASLNRNATVILSRKKG